MAGAPASMLSVGVVTRIGPRYAVKTQLKILRMRPNPSCKFRVGPQNPHQIPLFAPKTILPISIRPLQTKILCPPLLAMGGTNWGSSSLEWLKRNFFEPVSAKFVAKFADAVVNLAFFYLAFLLLVFVDLNWSKKERLWKRYILKNPIIFARQMLIRYLKQPVSKILRENLGTISDIGDEERREAKSSSASSPQEHWQFYSHSKEAEVVGQKEEINYLRNSSASSLQEHWQFYSHFKEAEVVGQKEEINNLRKQLISEEPKRRSVISILGMAGSGKTTLAKSVYDDVKDDFDCLAFITLPREYKIKNILIDILECVTCLSREDMEKLTEKKLGWMLRDHLKNKRYLVVIDDIWSQEAWDLMLEPILPDVANKSRVICTSRNEKVCPDDRTQRMRLLNDNEAWELFMKTIFAGKYPVTAGLSGLEETILRKILVKCGYLPQDILALGARLAIKENTITAWSNVLESANSFLTDGSNKCGRILA